MTRAAPTRRAGLATRLSVSLPLRCTRRFVAITGYDRALGLAAQAFIAAIPSVVVVTSVTDRSGTSVAERLVDRFGLTGDTAELVREALQAPTDATATLWSAFLLVVSVVGSTRALQRSFRAAWGLRAVAGWRGWVGDMASALALAAAVVTGAAIASLVDGPSPAHFTGLALRGVVFGTMWLLAIRLLLGWRLPWRPFLPGAVITGAGTSLTWLASGLWLPWALSSRAETYGLMGVFVVLITWLLVVALLLVLAAVVSAELWRSRSSSSAPAPAGPPIAAQ